MSALGPVQDPLAASPALAQKAEVRPVKDLIEEAVSRTYWDMENSQYFYWLPGDDYPTKYTAVANLILAFRKIGLTEHGDGMSETEQALNLVHERHKCDGSGYGLYRLDRTITHNRMKYVNLARVRALEPAPERHDWGEGFPWLGGYLKSLLGNADQFVVFHSWLAHFYQSALAHEPGTGMALILAGPTSIGKNFLGTAVLGQLLGGQRDAIKFLTSKDQFNSTMGDAPLWTMHDANTPTDKEREEFSNNLKRIVANREMHFRAMRREGYDLPWNGRILCTMNLDAESLRMLPNMEQSNMEKILLLRGFDPKVDSFPSDREVLAELPFYGAFLRDFTIPDSLRDNRFGVKHWHHPELYAAALSESGTSGAYELLDLFRKDLAESTKEPSWSGSSTELYLLIMGNEMYREACSRQFRSPQALGRAIAKLEQQKVKWIKRGNSVDRTTKITISLLA